MFDAEIYVLSLAGRAGNTADGNALMLVYEELVARRRRRETWRKLYVAGRHGEKSLDGRESVGGEMLGGLTPLSL